MCWKGSVKAVLLIFRTHLLTLNLSGYTVYSTGLLVISSDERSSLDEKAIFADVL